MDQVRPHDAARSAIAAPDELTYREREATAILASFVTSVSRRAERPLTCATCRTTIPVGAEYREDRLRAPVFGDSLASAICQLCVADGL